MGRGTRANEGHKRERGAGSSCSPPFWRVRGRGARAGDRGGRGRERPCTVGTTCEGRFLLRGWHVRGYHGRGYGPGPASLATCHPPHPRLPFLCLPLSGKPAPLHDLTCNPPRSTPSPSCCPQSCTALCSWPPATAWLHPWRRGWRCWRPCPQVGMGYAYSARHGVGRELLQCAVQWPTPWLSYVGFGEYWATGGARLQVRARHGVEIGLLS